MRKGLSLFLLSVLAVTILSGSVLAARHTIEVEGNETAANYTTYWNQTLQMNSSLTTSQYPYFNTTICIKCNSTQGISAAIGATIGNINFTLGDTRAYNTTLSHIQVYNATGTLIFESANASYADGTYKKAVFNITDSGNVTLTGNCNTTNSTFFIVWHMDSQDTNKSVSTQTTTGEWRYDNITYFGGSDTPIESVTLIYLPNRSWSNRDVVRPVYFNGTKLVEGQSTAGYYVMDSTGIVTSETYDFNGTDQAKLNVTYKLVTADSGTGGTDSTSSRWVPTKTSQPLLNPIEWLGSIVYDSFAGLLSMLSVSF